MGFADAIRSGFDNYANFEGRARRSAYWFWVLFAVLVNIVASIIDSAIGVGLLQVVSGLALLVPGIAVGIRRLHDTDRSGWWLLIALVPLVGAILLIVWFATEGTPGPNTYGPPVKGVGMGGAPGTGYGEPPMPGTGYGEPPSFS